MIGIPKTGQLAAAKISGTCFEGLKVETSDGEPAQLAIVDRNGRVIEVGSSVAREAFNVTLGIYKNTLIGQGHVRVYSEPPVAVVQNVSMQAA
ncbi:hypothetical protein [Chitinivorax sp. B]|uniref:hypothetical protein n=1 Tax=Chitinivorax sp. B TaxID=2502235 RepID=UPI0010F603DC|nr:hypothetical protein [Chitinivorax sp. B]